MKHRFLIALGMMTATLTSCTPSATTPSLPRYQVSRYRALKLRYKILKRSIKHWNQVIQGHDNSSMSC